MRYSVPLSDRAASLLGSSAGALNAALETWSREVGKATPCLAREEWNLLADLLNATVRMDAHWLPSSLAVEVEDGDKLEALGKKWGVNAASLAGKVRAFSTAELWAALLAVEHFWDNCSTLDMRADEWWLPDARAGQKSITDV